MHQNINITNHGIYYSFIIFIFCAGGREKFFKQANFNLHRQPKIEILTIIS